MKCLKTFIRMAVLEETKVSGKNYSAVLQPGQFMASKVELARLWGCDRKTATRIVQEFNQIGILRSESSNRTTIHTLICLSCIMLTDFYQESIDKEFLAEVCEFQSGITIPDEYQDDCLYILKRSPSALLYAVTKDMSIAQGRLKGLPTLPALDKTHADMFIRNLIIGFMHDSENQDIIQTLATRFGISGVTTETSLSVTERSGEQRLFHFELPLKYAPISGTNIIGPVVPFAEE